MATSAPLPKKEDLPKQLWDVATTLTPEAQNASLKKARELGFDLERGRIPLEETLINLDKAREVLLDAVEKNKLIQLPLKLQYSLLAQTQRVSQALSSLVSGSDTVVVLEDSVDDLTSSIWQFNLQNLSGEVLGFTQKMNQLKSQETLIRQVHREAQAFSSVRDQAQEIAARLAETDNKAQELSKAIALVSEQTDAVLSEITKNGDAATSKLAEVETINEAASAYLHSCEEVMAKISAHETESEQAKQKVEQTEHDLSALLKQFSTQFEEIKGNTDTLLAELRNDYEVSATAAKSEVERVTKGLSDSITSFREATDAELKTVINGVDNSIKLLSWLSVKWRTAFSVSVDSAPAGRGFSRHWGLSSDV